MEEKQELEKLKQYRKENFAVVIEKDRYSDNDDDFVLRTTHNGYQWSTLGLNPSEAKKVVEALQAHLGIEAENKHPVASEESDIIRRS